MAECHKLRPGSTYTGKQGFSYAEGISRESTGAQAICLHLATVPAGTRGKEHKHATHETAIYMLTGELVMWWGDALENRMDMQAGDMIHIPADVPHLAANLSDADASAVIARTDPHEQESVVLLPELEGQVPA